MSNKVDYTFSKVGVSSPEIKPCPFCGYEARVIRVPYTENPFICICQRQGCEASIGLFSKTREDAIKRWNQRIKTKY